MTHNPLYLVVDLFCGAGGTTIGFQESGVAKVIAAVNHDPKAIESHWANHPDVKHFEEDIRTLDLTELIEYVRQQRILYPNAKLILHASLECTNFSKAKGGKPRDADSRTLADHLHRYVEAIHPDEITIENVVEFMSWGPLDDNGKPLSRKNGIDFLRWCREMDAHGYKNDWRQLNSADFGAHTSRNRLFGQFVRPGMSFVWPEPTHAKNPGKAGMFEGLKKWEACRPCLDLDDHGTSIFTPGKIKSEKTFERIYAGLIKYVAGMRQKDFISKYYSGKPEGKNISIEGPAGTITTSDGQALVQTEFLLKYNSMASDGNMEHSVVSTDKPSPAITAQRQPNLVQIISGYYSSGDNNTSVDEVAPTVVTGDRHSLVSAEWIDRQFSQGTKHSSVDAPAGSLTTIPKMNLVQPEFINIVNIHCNCGYTWKSTKLKYLSEPCPKCGEVKDGTVTFNDSFLIDTAFNNGAKSIDDPCGTITANRKWYYLMNPQYMNAGGSLETPAFTLIARMDKAPPYLVQVDGGEIAIEVYSTDSPMVRKIKMFMAMYGIADIKMRMLKVVELKRIQGFPESYILRGTQADQKKFIGNSVQPNVVKVWMQAKAERVRRAVNVA